MVVRMPIPGLILVCLLTLSCNNVPSDGIIPPDKVANIPIGYACLLSPTKAFPPGWIYRVDKTGAYNLTKDRSKDTDTFKYKTAFGTYSTKVSWNVGAGGVSNQSFGMLAKALLKVNFKDVDVTVIHFGDAEFELMEDDTEDALLLWAMKNIIPREENKYYLVRDAIRAKSFEIEFTDDDLVTLGGEATLEKFASLKPYLSFSRTGGYKLSGTYEDYYQVCIKSVLLNFKRSGEGLASPRFTWSTDNIPNEDVAARLLDQGTL